MKKLGALMIAFLFAFLCTPQIQVLAKTTQVGSQEDLKDALSDAEVDVIELSQDIDTTEKITITRPVTIDGKGHTVKYVGTFGQDASPSNKVWGGIYVFQVYRTTATFRDIKLTGANAALLANGSTVRFEGTIDVSGNGFGGIELGQGKGVTEVNKLAVEEGSNIVNTTENPDAPTLWVPSDSADANVEMNGVTMTVKSGAELTEAEVEALFDDIPQDSPSTLDPLTWSITLSFIGLGLLGISFKKNKKTLRNSME